MKKLSAKQIIVGLVFIVAIIVGFSISRDAGYVGFAGAWKHLFFDTKYGILTLVATVIALGFLYYTYVNKANREFNDETMYFPTIFVGALIIILWVGIPASIGSVTTLKDTITWGR